MRLASKAKAKESLRRSHSSRPTKKLTVKNKILAKEKDLIDLIVAEVNVKEVTFDENIPETVFLCPTITPELKAEGMFRDLVRAVQDLRKTKGLAVGELASLTVETDDKGKELVDKNWKELSKVATLTKVDFKEVGEVDEVKIEGLVFKMNLEKTI